MPYSSVAVFFNTDLAVPAEMVGGEELLLERDRWMNEQVAAGHQQLDATKAMPPALHAPTLALLRHHEVRLSGVVLFGRPEGGLDDLVLWLVVSPDAHAAPREVAAGWLPATNLGAIAYALAAAVSSHSWPLPDRPLELPDDPGTLAFRKHVRRAQFRRREPTGAAANVRVIDLDRANPATPER